MFDIFSVYSLREGDDAFIGGLSNENQTVSYDSAGDANSGQFPITSQFFAALGITFLSETSAPGIPAVTFAKDSYNGGGTCVINTALNTPNPGPAGFIRIDAPLSVDSATAVFSATIYAGTANAKTVTKSLTLNKSKDGKIGEGITQIYIRSTDNPPATPAASAGVPAGWSATVAGATGSNPLWTSFGKREVGATIYTWQTPVRVEGQTVINPPLKNATGYLYYNTASASAPGVPQATGYDFATGQFSSLTANWGISFTAESTSGTKMWAVRYSVQETVAGGAQTITISSVFAHQNFDGLVTFTNLTAQGYQTATNVDNKISTATTNFVTGTTVDNKISTATTNFVTGTTVDNKITTASSNATFANQVSTTMTVIDGAKITTGSIFADRLQIGTDRSAALNGNFIRMFNNRIVVYSGGNARVIIGNLNLSDNTT